MPKYEFRRLECYEVIELLFVSSVDRLEMKKGGSRKMERVRSTTNFKVSSSSSGATGPTTSHRTFSAGFCSPIGIPNHGE